MEKNDELMLVHSGPSSCLHHHFVSTEIDFGNKIFINSLFHNTGCPTGWLRSIYTRMTLGAGHVKITTP